MVSAFWPTAALSSIPSGLAKLLRCQVTESFRHFKTHPQGRLFMKYRKLGRTGFEVSDIAYGLWGMSGWSGSDDQQSLDSLQLAVDSGCNFFDTAWAYGEGKSDGLLGETMQRNSKKSLYAASKIPPANDKWPALSKYKYHDVFSQE